MALVDLEVEARRDGTTVRTVAGIPERFGAEWRCRDREACERRYGAMTGPATPMDQPPPVPVDEEVPSWM